MLRITISFLWIAAACITPPFRAKIDNPEFPKLKRNTLQKPRRERPRRTYEIYKMPDDRLCGNFSVTEFVDAKPSILI